MNKWFCLLMVSWFSVLMVQAQSTRYLIRFKNKGGTVASIATPSAYLSQRAINRRTRYNIAIDSTDLPVSSRYLDSVRLSGNVVILNVSKWLNQVSIQTTDAGALSKINSFPFVQAILPIAARMAGPSALKMWEATAEETATFESNNSTENFYNYGGSLGQVRIHNGEFLHNIGLRGQGMIIGMLDAGFYQYTSLQAFDSINRNNQVLGTYDFVNNETSVAEDNSHGMACFSIIAANIPGQFIGTAPKASFYLFRSEDAATEYPIEEHNWVCAAERVDSAGGDVISSSLGYNVFDNPAFNHTYADMNGNTTMAAIGADLATKKGILVANSAGNEGNKSWQFIITPADGDSVLAVGAVTADSIIAAFSSYGPSADGQVKPDVVSVGQGTVLQSANNTIGTGNGTSFSCPNMAGLATCLWQGFPEMNNIKIIRALQQSGHLAGAPNNRMGYGIPNMKRAVMLLVKDFSTATVSTAACKATINWTSKDVAAMRYEIERKAPGDTGYLRIAERYGTGNVFTTHSYQYADILTSIQSGTVLYRIRQVIDTASGSFTADYIDTVQIAFNNTCSGTTESVLLLPNPARTQAFIQVITDVPVDPLYIRIYNTTGQVIYTEKRSKAAGAASFELPVANLAKGVYY
ncbi:MAG: S8 family serine peptidase, partial [Flavisolibacter sp.]|nr:S8 family serine peptidase [Flavisolibacter sp.]